MESLNGFVKNIFQSEEVNTIEVKDIMKEYQDIIQEIETFFNYSKKYNSYQKIILKLKQNKQKISSKFQSMENEINEYKQITKKNEGKTDKYNYNNISKLKNNKLEMEKLRNDHKTKEKELEKSKIDLIKLNDNLRTKDNNLENLKQKLINF